MSHNSGNIKREEENEEKPLITLLLTSVSTMRFYGNNVHFEGYKIPFERSDDKQNLILVVFSSDIYETRQKLVSKISYEITTSVRSCIFADN